MSQSNRNQSSSSSSQQAGMRRPSSQEMREAWHEAAAEAHKVLTRRDSSGFEGEQTSAAANYLEKPRNAPTPEKMGDWSKGGSSSHSLAKQMEHEERYGSGRRARIYGFAVAAETRGR